MAAPKRPVKAANNRASKKQLSSRDTHSLNQHNADTARFFKTKNHKRIRRMTRLISRQEIERINHGN